MIGRVQKFCSEVAVELKKVSWSSKKEVVDATWIVLISSFFLGSFIAICDFVLSKMLGLLIK